MNILIAEDEINTLESYRIALTASGHNVESAPDGEHALSIFWEHSHDPDTTNSFDLVILDYKLPKINGLELAKLILKQKPDQMILFASAFVGDLIKQSSSLLGKTSNLDYVEKPFDIDVLIEKIDVAQMAEDLLEFGVKINPKIIMENPDKIKLVLDKLKNLENKYLMDD